MFLRRTMALAARKPWCALRGAFCDAWADFGAEAPAALEPWSGARERWLQAGQGALWASMHRLSQCMPQLHARHAGARACRGPSRPR